MVVDGTYTAGQRPPTKIIFATNIANSSAVDNLTIQGDGGVRIPYLKSGANQGASGALAGELWVDTSAGNVIKMGT